MKITNSILEAKIKYIERHAKVSLYIQGQLLGRETAFQLIEKLGDGSEHVMNSGLLNRTEMFCYLNGIIDCIDQGW